MKNLCIITPLNSTADLKILADGVKSVCGKDYKFSIIAVCDENINPNLTIPKEIIFVKVDEGLCDEEKITKGFEYCKDYDATIVLNRYEPNWQEYFSALLREYENGADIVYTKKNVEPKNIFQRISNWFKKVGDSIYQFFVKLFFKNKDLKVFNSFQLFSQDVAQIIADMPQKNTYLRNFDCWNGYNVVVNNTVSSETRVRKLKFFNKNIIISLILSLLFVGFALVTGLLYSKISYSFRFTYITIGIAISIFTLFFACYNFIKGIALKRMGVLSLKKDN